MPPQGTEQVHKTASTLHPAVFRAFLSTLAAASMSGFAAALLHVAPDRPDAARILPICLVWGFVAIAGSWWTGRSTQSVPNTPFALIAVVFCAAVVRAPLIGTPPVLSDDVYRYLWEGLALNAGHNPFIEAPQAISGLDDPLRDLVNHGAIPSLYPPVALWWFRLLSACGGTTRIAQLATAAVDVTTVAGLAVYLRNRPWWPVWLYALHPLPALESASGAHIDVVAIALAVWAVVAWQRGKNAIAIAIATAAFLTKLLPILLFPALLRKLSGRARAAALGGAAAASVVLAMPVLDAGPQLGNAMGVYASSWTFNGLIYPWLSVLVGPPARVVLVLVGLTVGARTVMMQHNTITTWYIVGSAFVLLSPTVHPWYVLWALVPALLTERWGWAVAAIALLMSYAILGTLDPATGIWHDGAWLWFLCWPAALTALGVEAFLRRGGTADRPSHSPPRTAP